MQTNIPSASGIETSSINEANLLQDYNLLLRQIEIHESKVKHYSGMLNMLQALRNGGSFNESQQIMASTKDTTDEKKTDQLNPQDNFLDHLIKTINPKVTAQTKFSYEKAKDVLVKFFQQEGKLQYINIDSSKKEYIHFHSITTSVLNEINSWMEAREYTKGTIKTYMSYIKAGFTKAQKKRLITAEQNPFEDGKYVLHTPPKIGIGLELAILARLYNYTPDKKKPHGLWSEELAYDFWIMSLKTSGVKIGKLLSLEKKQVNSFYEKHWEKADRIMYDPTLERLFEKWGTKSTTSKYVFPFLELNNKDIRKLENAVQGIADKEERDRIYKETLQRITRCKTNAFTTQMNRYMNKIANNLGFSSKITTRSAKDTFDKENVKFGISRLTNLPIIKKI